MKQPNEILLKLQNQLKALERFETLFNSKTLADFKKNLGYTGQADSVQSDMNNNKLVEVAFPKTSVEMQKEIQNALAYFQTMQDKTTKSTEYPVIDAISNAISTSNPELQAQNQEIKLIEMRNMIANNKTAVNEAIASMTASEVEIDEEAVSAVVEPTVPNPLYAKLLTAGLATAGLSMAGFSALMQFGPKFALLAGVHLYPAALIAIAAVGVLLVSISLYRGMSAYMQARDEATDSDVVASQETVESDNPTPTCFQRVSQYVGSFQFSGLSSKSAADEAELGADSTSNTVLPV